jgi:predicted acetyltransferase
LREFSEAVLPSLQLCDPTRNLRDSYGSLIGELEAGAEKRIPFPLTYPFDDFDALLATLRRNAEGIDLPGGFVPNSTFWLVREGREIVGVSNLRHRLTETLLREGGNIGYGIRPSARRNGFGREILRQTLLRARNVGLSRVLVTCGKQNTGSVRIILGNGGVFESEEFMPDRGEIVRRYWIEIGTARAS